MLLAGVLIIATRTGWRSYMFAVVCIHDSVLGDEEIFYVIVTMVCAVFVIGEVDRQFSPVWEEMEFLNVVNKEPKTMASLLSGLTRQVKIHVIKKM